MNGLPGIFIHDGGLRVLRDDPVRFIVERGLVGFVGDGFAPLADRVAAVFIPVEDVQNRAGVPQSLRSLKSDSLPLEILLLPGKVFAGSVVSLFRHLLSNLCGVLPAQEELEDLTDYGSWYFVNGPFFRVVGVFLVPIRRGSRQVFSRLGPRLHARLDLLGNVPAIPFVDDVAEGREIIGDAAGAVHAVVDGDEADSRFRELDLCVEAYVEVVPAEPAHILADDRPDQSIVHVCHHGLRHGSG